MKISAVVPTYNDEDVIEECLQSLLNQSTKFDEIIIVDDGSTDNTLQVIKKYPVKIIKTKHGERSYARNVGWKEAFGDIIAFIESDSVYNNTWVENVLDEFKKDANAVIDRRAVYEPKTFIARYNDEMFTLRSKNYVPFSAWNFKNDVLQKLGGFDEDLICSEDVDLGIKLIRNNYKIIYAQDAIQYHKGEPASIIEFIKRNWWFGNNIHEFYRKHPKKIPFLKLSIYTFLLPLIYVPKFFLSALVGLYMLLLIRISFRGLRGIKYILVSPFLSISGGIIFTLGFYYSIVKRISIRIHIYG